MLNGLLSVSLNYVNSAPSTTDQATSNPASLDSSALLATLNNLTQGTLNIPPFLSSNPIATTTSQPINTAINFNNTNSHPQQIPLSAAPQFSNMNVSTSQPPVSTPMPTNNGFLQPPGPSSSHTKVATNNTNSKKAGTSVNDPLDFDYGDMDEDDESGHGPKGEINNTAAEKLTSAINVQPVNV